MSAQANITEIFPSFQGEGPYVGMPQLFIRFGGCHLHCAYCDEPQSLTKQSTCKIFHSIDGSAFDLRSNPLTIPELTSWIEGTYEKFPSHQSVSLTGGEPLLHSSFLKGWLPKIHGRFQIYLETSGTQPERLAPILSWIDTIAMDIKLPSVGGEGPFWEEHEAFLKMAQDKDLFVKVVCSAETSVEELEMACQIVKKVNPKIPFVLQPVTPFGTVTQAPPSDQLERWQKLCQNYLSQVLIQPQAHKMLGIK
jgi:organic radical activating enzyme